MLTRSNLLRRSVCALSLLMTLSASAQTLKLHGVLVQSPSDPLCLRFEADDGRWFKLNNQGGRVAGDRMYVEGTASGTVFSPCEAFAIPFFNVTFVRPGFAGIGTLVRQGNRTRLQTDDGRVYAVRTLGGFSAGARVYVRGFVNTNQNPPQIDGNVIGAAYSGFGRLTSNVSGDLRWFGDDGIDYRLDALGDAGAAIGSYVYVEGILGAAGPPRPLTSVTARRAFGQSGRVILNAQSQKVFESAGLVFNDIFSVAGLSGFAVGSKVYVRGQQTVDYDYLEPRNGNSIRRPTVGAGFSGTGTIYPSQSRWVSLDGLTQVILENTDAFVDGDLAYIAGQIASSGPGTVTLSHNQALLGVFIEGELFDGFECTPILISGSLVFFLENTGGGVAGQGAVAVGGVSDSAAPCPYFTIVDNTIELNDCPLCQ